MAHEVFVILPETRDGLSRHAAGRQGGKDVTGVHARPHAAGRQGERM